jgi:formylglycine-generating enzyme required for sulfatase activity
MDILHVKIISVLMAGIVPAGVVGVSTLRAPSVEAPAVVEVAPHAYSYRLPGDFRQDGAAIDGPLVHIEAKRPLTIMRTQVTAAAYDLCAEQGACQPRDRRAKTGTDIPATGVSWQDATAYAQWLSAQTGETWRLPTDEEWALAAGTRFADDALGTADFTGRWIARYEQETSRNRTVDGGPKPMGTFGENENGLVDVSGNVWEWTDTCFVRQSVDADGRLLDDPVTNCGVRVVEGQHRTYITDFIRDARAGGCSVGVPPANLGFRLVREDTPTIARVIARLVGHLRRIA